MGDMNWGSVSFTYTSPSVCPVEGRVEGREEIKRRKNERVRQSAKNKRQQQTWQPTEQDREWRESSFSFSCFVVMIFFLTWTYISNFQLHVFIFCHITTRGYNNKREVWITLLFHQLWKKEKKSWTSKWKCTDVTDERENESHEGIWYICKEWNTVGIYFLCITSTPRNMQSKCSLGSFIQFSRDFYRFLFLCHSFLSVRITFTSVLLRLISYSFISLSSSL